MLNKTVPHSRTNSISPLKQKTLKKDHSQTRDRSASNNRSVTKVRSVTRDRIATIKAFTGSVLQNNYVIGGQIGIGSFGQVFEIIDMKRKDLPLVVKFSSNLVLA